MSPPPPFVWAVPDLALVVCPADCDPWNGDFCILYSTVFLKHDEKVRDSGFAWALSDELKSHLLDEFPWHAAATVGWVRDLMVTLSGWLEEVGVFPAEHHPDAQVEPDIAPTYVGDATKHAWVDVLATCARNQRVLSRVASFPQQTADRLLLLLDEGEAPFVVQLVRQVAEWEAVLGEIEPWVGNRLPSGGEHPYRPPRHWHAGQPFPTQRCVRGGGFLDADGRIWVWDLAEGHWDIQEARQGRGRYMRVTTDGIALR